MLFIACTVLSQRAHTHNIGLGYLCDVRLPSYVFDTAAWTILAYRENDLRSVDVIDPGCLFKVDLAKCPLHNGIQYEPRQACCSFRASTVCVIEGLYCRGLAARPGDRTTGVIDPQSERN